MDPPAGAIDELHFHLPEIVLTKLPGQTFETNQRLRRLRAKRGHQRVQGCLASLDSRPPELAAESPATLDPAFAAESPVTGFRKFADRAWPTDLSLSSLRRIIDMHHRHPLARCA